MMNYASWSCVLTMLAASSLSSFAEAPSAESSSMVRMHQARVEDLTRRMIETDQSIERKIEVIVKNLSEVSDSMESRTRVVQTKEKAIEGLMNFIKLYKRMRDERFLAANEPRPEIERAELTNQVSVLDKRLDRRVQQIMELTTTLAQHEDLDEFTHYYDGYDFRTESNPAHEQNRLETTRGERIRKEVLDKLQLGVDLLQKENKTLRAHLEVATNEEQREILRNQIAVNDRKIEERWTDMQKVLSEGDPGTRKIGRQNAIALERMVLDMVEQIKREHTELMRLNTERDLALKRLKLAQ